MHVGPCGGVQHVPLCSHVGGLPASVIMVRLAASLKGGCECPLERGRTSEGVSAGLWDPVAVWLSTVAAAASCVCSNLGDTSLWAEGWRQVSGHPRTLLCPSDLQFIHL